jgi:acyl-CoA synthetase (AMP-forming)/AMP-acid ligase II
VLLLLFASWRLGAVITPVNPSMTDGEVARQLNDSGARLLAAEDDATAGGGATLAVGERRGFAQPTAASYHCQRGPRSMTNHSREPHLRQLG